jgi:hypothetical protein
LHPADLLLIKQTAVLIGAIMPLVLLGAIKRLLLILWEPLTRLRFIVGEQLAEPVDKAVTLAEPVHLHTELLITFL